MPGGWAVRVAFTVALFPATAVALEGFLGVPRRGTRTLAARALGSGPLPNPRNPGDAGIARGSCSARIACAAFPGDTGQSSTTAAACTSAPSPGIRGSDGATTAPSWVMIHDGCLDGTTADRVKEHLLAADAQWSTVEETRLVDRWAGETTQRKWSPVDKLLVGLVDALEQQQQQQKQQQQSQSQVPEDSEKKRAPARCAVGERYIEWWWRDEWLDFEAHRDVSEREGASMCAAGAPVLRCPTWAHVLCVAADPRAERGAPTCVFHQPLAPPEAPAAGGAAAARKAAARGDWTAPYPVTEVAVVPPVKGRLVRFRGELLHGVPRPGTRYLHDPGNDPARAGDEGDGDGSEVEFIERFVVLFNTWREPPAGVDEAGTDGDDWFSVVADDDDSRGSSDGGGGSEGDGDGFGGGGGGGGGGGKGGGGGCSTVSTPTPGGGQSIHGAAAAEEAAAEEAAASNAAVLDCTPPSRWRPARLSFVSLAEEVAASASALASADAAAATSFVDAASPPLPLAILGVPLLGDRRRRGRASNRLILLAPKAAAERALLRPGHSRGPVLLQVHEVRNK